MSTPSLESLPSLLRILVSSPSPDKVLDALTYGPLAAHGVVGSSLLVADGGDLVIVGDAPAGVLPWSDSLRIMPKDFHGDIVAAGRPGSSAVSTWARTYSTLNPDLWQMLVDRTADGCLIHLPLRYDDAVVGGLGLLTARPTDLDPILADCLSAALGLWVSAASTRAGQLVAAVRQRVRPVLSHDDIEILRLVDSGLSTAAIAKQLHLSPSTIKNRIANASRALNATGRREAVASARRIGALDG